VSDQSDIQWTDTTWSPATGCDRTSEGCDHCYALTLAKRLKAMGSAKYQTDGDSRTSGPGFGVAMHADALTLPLAWRKPRKIFVNSMSDLFHAKISDEFIAQVFAVMAAAPQHVYQILTKRHGRMRSLLNSPAFGEMVWRAFVDLEHPRKDWATAEKLLGDRGPRTVMRPLPWVHLGVSVENQRWADIRIPALLQTPAAVRFLSCEPLLGEVSLRQWLGTVPECGCWGDGGSAPIDWVIVGGESGPGARPMDSLWAMDVAIQCGAHRIPVFVKQLGSVWARENGALDRKGGDPQEWPVGLRVREFPTAREAVAV
jgi:protein gp37